MGNFNLQLDLFAETTIDTKIKRLHVQNIICPAKLQVDGVIDIATRRDAVSSSFISRPSGCSRTLRILDYDSIRICKSLSFL